MSFKKFIECNYRTAGHFRGGNFCEFHKSKTICVNFTLEIPTLKLVLLIIRENYPLEKLGIPQFVKIFPLKNNPLYGILLLVVTCKFPTEPPKRMQL